ncbi:mRNA cap guanine-N7 methyltransferase 2 isoform X1 [Phragmites australis]|uniref:mRNA cap guanine-N7 methyltransferase 2 isoform X1 n=1 Tax=Phragmites australis TaxID=29695 RepID=UPI002D7665D6|nr:mRNA cap guanine-N7 methyltransferase 2 isoform X1 [Phragmites australis]
MAVTPHHRLYEFAKTALIKIFAFPYATVCDMYCDGGVDTDKWCDAQVGHYIGIDASASGVSDARELWENKRKPFTAEFIKLDPSDDDFEAQLQEKGIQADIVCCMQHLQLCFESEERARKLLNNVSSLLKPGGYFFGMTPDSSTIWTKYQKNVEASHNKGLKTVPNSVRSENYTITFEVEEEKFPFFGKKYQLKFANEAVFDNHCLVHFPSLMRLCLNRLAREAGLEYVEIQNLTEFYDDNRTQFAPMLGSCGASFVDPRGKLLGRSYDILGLYSTFVFQKPDPDAIPPVVTPDLHDPDSAHEEEWLRRQPASADDGRRSHPDVIPMDHEKGILGPGPADMRL